VERITIFVQSLSLDGLNKWLFCRAGSKRETKCGKMMMLVEMSSIMVIGVLFVVKID
jgi:hypothetical protein